MDNLETQETLGTRDRMWKNGKSRDTGNNNRQTVKEWTIQRNIKHKEMERGRMDNLETQETLRDRTWKNGQSRDRGNIKHKRQNVE